jgi:drug/metabolite transporter (DMT)-like permease
VGVAYTLQIVGQQRAHPAHAAILLSLESVFAALGGWLVLGEVMSARSLLGCALMLGGMLLSQLYGYFAKPAGRPLEAEA